MTFRTIDLLPENHTPTTAQMKRVLVVDDSRFQRRILRALLIGLGYEVTEAESAEEALSLSEKELPDLVLSDWIMPGMSGLEFCKAFREISEHQYAYFIILTSKSKKNEIALGLDSGADDFLTKPVDRNELRARLKAGERILEMQRELRRGNTLLSETLDELQLMYDALDRDLLEAKTLQQSLLRDRYKEFGQANLSMLLQSSGHVGGDLVGHFPAGENMLGLYAIDVSGHGISSALMTARLAGYLSGSSPDQNVALCKTEGGEYAARPPKDVVADLNDLVLDEMQTEHYFTLMLIIADLQTGQLTISQAGQPHPVIQRRDGRVEQCGTGGFPVGLMSGVDFEQFELSLEPGDRLLVMSDGVTECPNTAGQLFDEPGVENMMQRLQDRCGPAFLDGVIDELAAYAATRNFPDDVSAILLEYAGPST